MKSGAFRVSFLNWGGHVLLACSAISQRHARPLPGERPRKRAPNPLLSSNKKPFAPAPRTLLQRLPVSMLLNRSLRPPPP